MKAFRFCGKGPLVLAGHFDGMEALIFSDVESAINVNCYSIESDA